MPMVMASCPAAGCGRSVVDDVEADLRLLAHDVSDRVVQAGVERRLVVRLLVALRLEEFLQLWRPDQAADMRGQDSAGVPSPAFRRCLAREGGFARGFASTGKPSLTQ